MIEIKHVKKAFDSHVLFEELNVTIESGDFVVFSGSSGCGGRGASNNGKDNTLSLINI